MYFKWTCPNCLHVNESTVEDAMEGNTVCQGCYEEFDIAIMTEVVILEIENVKEKRKKKEMKKIFG